MKLPSLWSGGGRGAPGAWSRGQGLLPQAFWSMESELGDMLRAFDRLPSLRGAAGVPKVSVSESRDAFDIAVELPGVDETDIRLNVEDNQLVISGEKREESQRDERDWHVEERSYGSFYRAIPLPFRPEEQGVEAVLDRGVLTIRVKKPAEAQQRGPRSVEIRRGAAPGQSQQAAQEAPAGSQANAQPTSATPRPDQPKAAE
ncbi:MAG: Hsp20/alpha crystallin family protein [Methylocystis sp.]|uniref:Hsp20/alpha crystallin family protein n=1 Tax=Methylocystis sp. TaxID=1911079 RepID=UPI003DA59BA0